MIALLGEEGVSLRDGSRVHVRPIQPSDKARLAAGFEHLSERSRYRRFLYPIKRLTQSDLAYLTEVDHRDHEALIALDPDTGDAIAVAKVHPSAGEGRRR